MKIIKKILVIISLSIIIINIMSPISNADYPDRSTFEEGQSMKALELEDVVDGFDADEVKLITTKGLRKIIGKLLGVLRIGTGLIMVIVIATTGFKYIVNTTPGVKSEIKNKMFSVIIGLILVFCAVSIAEFILGAFE